MYVKRRLIMLFVPVSLLLAAGLVAGLVLRGWPGTGGSSAEFPAFVYHSPEVERAYGLAVQHQELFPLLPCYCGCGVMPEDPHRNLLDCFITGDGSLNPHASGCRICVDIAIDGTEWWAQGKSPAEVRSLVEAKYQSYGPATNP
jgi:hypothetical protein